ncbi:MAG: hypothetical protein WCH39_16105 [Schlesneria sp.]|jgi:hypothetical protein
MHSQIGFAIDMEVIANGESFFVRGDDQRVVLSFPSIGAARRILAAASNDQSETFFQTAQLPVDTIFESQVSGRTIALSGRGIRSSLPARMLGIPGTRFFLLNLLRCVFS